MFSDKFNDWLYLILTKHGDLRSNIKPVRISVYKSTFMVYVVAFIA
jgi:hypothetical protein